MSTHAPSMPRSVCACKKHSSQHTHHRRCAQRAHDMNIGHDTHARDVHVGAPDAAELIAVHVIRPAMPQHSHCAHALACVARACMRCAPSRRRRGPRSRRSRSGCRTGCTRRRLGTASWTAARPCRARTAPRAEPSVAGLQRTDRHSGVRSMQCRARLRCNGEQRRSAARARLHLGPCTRPRRPAGCTRRPAAAARRRQPSLKAASRCVCAGVQQQLRQAARAARGRSKYATGAQRVRE